MNTLCLLGRPGHGAAPGHHHLAWQAHQRGRQVAEPLLASLPIAVRDAKILTLDGARVTQPWPAVLHRWVWPRGGLPGRSHPIRDTLGACCASDTSDTRGRKRVSVATSPTVESRMVISCFDPDG